MRNGNDTGEQKKGCGYCSFAKYNLSREESHKNYLRAKPIHVAGAGKSFEEIYLRKESDSRFCLIVDADSAKIVRPIKFCPICGRALGKPEQ